MSQRKWASFWLRHRWLLAALLVGCGIRVAAILITPEQPLVGDEKDYLEAARKLAAGRHVSAFPFRSPLYIFLCAGVLKLFGTSDALRFMQVGLEAGSILGIYLLAQRTLGTRTGSTAACLYALYPNYIAYSHYLWSETLSLCLLIWSLVAVVSWRERPSYGVAAWTGLLWGIATLNKPATMYIALPVFAWVLYSADRRARSEAFRQIAVALAALALTIAPWSIHMSRQHQELIVVSTGGQQNLRVGNNNYPPPHFDLPSRSTYTIALAKKQARKIGLFAWIKKDPQRFADRTLLKMTELWSPTSFTIRHIYWSKYAHYDAIRASKPLRLAIAYSVILATTAILVLSIVGFFVSRRDHGFGFGLTAAYVAPYLAMMVLTPVLSRYRLPLMVFAILYAAFCLTHPRLLRQQWSRPAVVVPIVCALAALGFLWTRSIPALLNVLG